MAEKLNAENKPDQKSVFVTDAVGAAGRATVKALISAGHKVSAVVHTTDQADRIRAMGALPVFVDITRPGEIVSMMKVSQSTVIVHVAPQLYNAPPLLGKVTDTSALVEGTRAVVAAAESAGLEFIVHVSFAFLYGDHGGESVDESTKLAKVKTGLIGAGREAEKIVAHSSVPACILRAGFVYGAGSAEMEAVGEALRVGKALTTGKAGNFANFIYSEDLAKAIALAIEFEAAGEVYNIVDEKPVSLSTFVDAIADALGLRMGGGLDLARFFGGRGDSTLADLSLRVSNSKAKEDLGWKPNFGNLNEGVDHMLIAWRAAMTVR